jgi:hypothetical protein
MHQPVAALGLGDDNRFAISASPKKIKLPAHLILPFLRTRRVARSQPQIGSLSRSG